MITNNPSVTSPEPLFPICQDSDGSIYPLAAKAVSSDSGYALINDYYFEPTSHLLGQADCVISEYRTIFLQGSLPYIECENGTVSVGNNMARVTTSDGINMLVSTTDNDTSKSMTGCAYDTYDPYLKRKTVQMPIGTLSGNIGTSIGGFRIISPYYSSYWQYVIPRIRYKVIVATNGDCSPTNICVWYGGNRSGTTCPDLSTDGSTDIQDGCVGHKYGDGYFYGTNDDKHFRCFKWGSAGSGTSYRDLWIVTGEFNGCIKALGQPSSLFISNPNVWINTDGTESDWRCEIYSYTAAIYSDVFTTH